MQAATGQTYDFSARPKLLKPKTKYRQVEDEEYQQSKFQNLMIDPRVVRGNTYAPIVTSQAADPVINNSQIRQVNRTIQIPKEQEYQNHMMEPGTPPAVPGRQHQEIQTDDLVEVLTDQPPEYEKDTQTDFFIDRPPPRFSMQTKTGLDRETQIWDGDLFDFDYEVEPILQVLIGKCLEQSRMEVLEEEQLRKMKEEQQNFADLKNKKLAEMHKLEEDERRLLEEKKARVQQYQTVRQQNISDHQKIISRLIGKNYLNKTQGNVLQILEDQGVFRNPLEVSLYDSYLPWLYDEVKTNLLKTLDVKSYLNNLQQEVIVTNNKLHQNGFEIQMEKRAQLRAEEQKRQQEKAERQRLRELEQKRKAEQLRRQKLQQTIREKLIDPQGEMKQNILANKLTDIDGNQKDEPYVGLFGGLISEVILYLEVLLAYAQERKDLNELYEYLQKGDTTLQVFDQLINQILPEGVLELSVDEKIETILTGQNPDLNIASLQTYAYTDAQERNDVINLLRNSTTSIILNKIQKSEKDIVSDPDLIETLLDHVLNVFFNPDSEIKDKIKITQSQNVQTFKQVGVCFMRPKLVDVPLHAQSELNGVVIQSEIEGEQGKAPPPRNLAESDFVNQSRVFPNSVAGQDLQVLVLHNVAETVLRREILKIIARAVSQVEENEYNILYDTTDLMFEKQRQILSIISPQVEIPVLDMEAY